VPTLLDDALLTDTLQALPGWVAGDHAIYRDITVAPELLTELRRQVLVDSGAMKHDVLLTEQPDGATRFILTTAGAGGVTELDIAMASHISDLMHTMAANEPGVNAVRHGDPLVSFRTSEVRPEDPGIGAPQP
jgi:4a-hydroxytetrahydrobiopterin dehydratase